MEFLPGVHIVPGTWWSRIYLIEGEKLALVDTGIAWNAGKVLDYIRAIGRKPEDLEYILMTHSHPDHASSALALCQRTGACIVAHAGDTRTCSDQQVSLSYMGVFNCLKLPLPFFQRACVGQVVQGGEELPIGGGMQVVHTPGHTPGSVCYLLKERGVLFSGDTLFSDGVRLSRSVPFPGYNARHYQESLEKLAALDFEALCGGHGAPLLRGASGQLRRLLASRPEPPSWASYLGSLPRRLYQARGLRGEDY